MLRRPVGRLPAFLALAWWVVMCHATMQQCTRGTCTPSADLSLSTVRELGRFATEAHCLALRAQVERAWTQLEAEERRQAPPAPDGLEVTITFACERDERDEPRAPAPEEQ